MKPKVIQIETQGPALYALCDNGEIWMCPDLEQSWVKVALPKEIRPDAKTEAE